MTSQIVTPAEVPESEFSTPFAQGMADRMSMSYFKYGLVADAFPEKVDAIASLKQRLEKYESTGNTEFLIDAANFAMIEWMKPKHSKAFFSSTDSDQSPGRIWHGRLCGSQNSNTDDHQEKVQKNLAAVRLHKEQREKKKLPSFKRHEGD